MVLRQLLVEELDLFFKKNSSNKFLLPIKILNFSILILLSCDALSRYRFSYHLVFCIK
jgi:hypothetical protein